MSFADAGITTPEDFAGKTIGNWGFGNEYEVFAVIGAAGLDPATDVSLVQQQFDMVVLLDGSIDAAEAMTYNEYAQVLEAVNPDTGELYTPEDFNVVSYEDIGVGMLQDAIWADSGRLAETMLPTRTRRRVLVAASIEGWIYCRDNPEECRRIIVASGSTLGSSHQLWQMNEVNKLIWPSPDGIGYIDQGAWGSHGRDQPEHAEPRRRDRPDGTAHRRCLHQRDRRSCVGVARWYGARPVRPRLHPDRRHLERRRRVITN